MATLDAEGRKERAKNAALARWGVKPDWETIPLDEGMVKLGELRAEAERASLTLQRRQSTATVSTALCYNPNCKRGMNGDKAVIDIAAGRFAGQRSRHNPETGMMETAYACCGECFLYLTSHFLHFSPAPKQAQQAANVPEATVINEAAKNMI